jgi:hypothetical protein
VKVCPQFRLLNRQIFMKICMNVMPLKATVTSCQTRNWEAAIKSPSTDDRRGGIRPSGGGPGARCVAYVFVFLCSIIICRRYKLTLSDKAQVTVQLSQFFRFSVKIISRPALAGRPGKIFNRDPYQLSAAHMSPSLNLLLQRYW